STIILFLMITSTSLSLFVYSFVFNDTATTGIYTLSLHDALPISHPKCSASVFPPKLLRSGLRIRVPIPHWPWWVNLQATGVCKLDRKSTRLNSSHRTISYAVFCLKKKKKKLYPETPNI